MVPDITVMLCSPNLNKINAGGGFCKTSGSTPKNAPEVLLCIIFSKTQKFCKRLDIVDILNISVSKTNCTSERLVHLILGLRIGTGSGVVLFQVHKYSENTIEDEMSQR